MKKLIISAIMLLLLTALSVSAAGDLTIESVSVSPTHGAPGDTVSIEVTVKNVGNQTIDRVSFESTELEHNNNTLNVPAIPDIYGLGVNESKSVSFEVLIPSTPAGTYEATLTATAGSETETEAYALNVELLDSLEINEESVDVKGNAGDTVSAQVTVTNTGSTDLTNFEVAYSGDSGDNEGDELRITFSGAKDLAPGESFTLEIEAELDSHLDIGSYSGSVEISAHGNSGLSKSFALNTEVEPKLCKYGELGDLQVNIDDPDEGDSFKPGEEIKVKAEVDNGYSKDLYVYVKAYLFNMDEGDEVESTSSEYVKIKDGESEDFELSFKVPTDIDENDEYRLYVKAYKKGGEDEHCVLDHINLEMEREEDDITVNDLFASKTEELSAGEEIMVTADLENVGTEDQDEVFVEVVNTKLGIDEKSETFSLSEYGEDDDNYLAHINVKIPDDAETGEYNLKVYVHYADKKDVAGLIGLKVTKGAAKKSAEGVEITPEKSDLSVMPGQKVALPVLLENKGSEKAEFSLDATNAGPWAEVIGTESPDGLFPGDVYHAYIYLQIKEDAEPGVHDLRINIRDEKGLIQSKLVSFTVEGATSVEEPAEESSKIKEFFAGKTVWIIGDIVLLIVALIFLRALFKK